MDHLQPSFWTQFSKMWKSPKMCENWKEKVAKPAQKARRDLVSLMKPFDDALLPSALARALETEWQKVKQTFFFNSPKKTLFLPKAVKLVDRTFCMIYKRTQSVVVEFWGTFWCTIPLWTWQLWVQQMSLQQTIERLL